MQAMDIMETCLYAGDLDAAERFYHSILGLETAGREEGRHVFFRCGPRMLLIFNPSKTAALGGDVPAHGATGQGHLAFAVPEDSLPAWRDRLESRGVIIEKDVRWPWGGRSIYFRDPAGNSLELTTPRIWSLDEEAFFKESPG